MPTNPPASLIADLVGTNVMVRTVTFHYTGRLAAIDTAWLQLDDAAWVADSGRWSAALNNGTLVEVEPYPGPCWVAVASIVDIAPWAHELPRTVK